LKKKHKNLSVYTATQINRCYDYNTSSGLNFISLLLLWHRMWEMVQLSLSSKTITQNVWLLISLLLISIF